MQVLEHDDEWLVRGEHLDEETPCGEDLVAIVPCGLLRVAEGRADDRAETQGVLFVVTHRAERVPQRHQETLVGTGAEEPAQQTTEGEERHRGAVGQTLRGRHHDITTQARGELLHQPRLAGAGGRADRHELRPALAERAPRDEVELRKVRRAAEERRALHSPTQELLEEHRRGKRRGLALRGDALVVPEAERAGHRATRPVAHEDRAFVRVLLQSRGDVHRIAGDEKVAAASRAATTSPVFTPMRRSSAAVSGSAATRWRNISAAARARSASSPWACGIPKTAITASPMNFSSVPPCSATTSRAIE